LFDEELKLSEIKPILIERRNRYCTKSAPNYEFLLEKGYSQTKYTMDEN
jgi:hypothetical protein